MLRSLFFLVGASSCFAAPLPRAAPESVGMSREGLAKIGPAVEALVTEGKLAGGSVMVLRKGKVVYQNEFGFQDLEGWKPMAPDTIFRIFSMTKAVTSAAALMLCEEGKLSLDDPIQRHLTDLKEFEVFPGKKADRQPTVRDLLRHTAGFAVSWKPTEVSKTYREAGIPSRKHALSVLEQSLAKVQLAEEPGGKWEYGISTDVLARVIERVSGQSFGDFLQERFLSPLGMKDTGFHVPEDKVGRFAVGYEKSRGKLKVKDDPTKSVFLKAPVFQSGGAGLVSTMSDYAVFLQMIANGGEYLGKRYLRTSTVDLMRTNQLPLGIEQISFGKEQRYGTGFGLGFCVRVADDARWDKDAVIGEYGWGGLASTHYWVSPKHELVVITMEQTIPYNWNLEHTVKPLVYSAVR